MRVLTVCSGNSKSTRPFIHEQSESLAERKITFNHFYIHGRKIHGYLKNYLSYRKRINEFEPDIIHAYYGLSGLFACLQRKIPVVITFLGSDINNHKVRFLSKFAERLSSKSIFVSRELADLVKSKKSVIIPFGVREDIFYPQDQRKARKAFNFNPEKKYILFSSSFSIPVKNYTLARKAVKLLNNGDIEIVELMRGYDRNTISRLINACDCLLLTSLNEGSPQIIKEAMACNCPVVSTMAGDSAHLLGNTEGCFVSSYEPSDVAEKITRAIRYREEYGTTNGRMRITELELGIDKIAEKIAGIYDQVHHA